MNDRFPKLNLCHHQRYHRECFRCQMQAFLCVNEYSNRLPHVDNDACRVIFQHLRRIVLRDIVAKRLAGAEARHLAMKVTINSVCGFMRDFDEDYAHDGLDEASDVNPLEELRAAENRQKSIKKKERKARQQQTRRKCK